MTRRPTHRLRYGSREPTGPDPPAGSSRTTLQKTRTRGGDVGNGRAFVASWLLRACASLGVKLLHSAPGRPQGRGRVERRHAGSGYACM